MTGAPTIVLPALASPVREVWHTLLSLAEDPTLDWTLIGGQMVLLHALEHGVDPSQISQDGNVVGNVRADQGALRRLVAALEADGYRLTSISAMGSLTATASQPVHGPSSWTSWPRKGSGSGPT